MEVGDADTATLELLVTGTASLGVSLGLLEQPTQTSATAVIAMKVLVDMPTPSWSRLHGPVPGTGNVDSVSQ
ncbi:hypothetical protein CH283_27015 [Rhodococcus sp. 05-2254-2]|nr:hypothetical protein CH261_24760 [Rhodococcus sp. 05-2254-3]OZE44531.1 hypothetical protein CH283_27015 [Rhodococcus sp. 05-2254-2]